MDEKSLWIELVDDGLKHLVLRKNYGDHIEGCFGMTRQGIRWRFQRLFNEIYTSSLETILWMESLFGTELRQKAMAIARERAELRKKAQKLGKIELPRR